ncbi:unnamed protein product [Rhizoctonia solani]|uniref:Polysaccharide lyase 14 domain-containing protein n=1 Tax=Rhizoctonia solani TaxID=456999 RepID=A0A8H2XJ17_9AGAM|nr:unnamed protein product [Rhizoctonia solani]
MACRLGHIHDSGMKLWQPTCQTIQAHPRTAGRGNLQTETLGISIVDKCHSAAFSDDEFKTTSDDHYDPFSLVGIFVASRSPYSPVTRPSSVPVQGIAAKVLPLGLGNSANSWTTVPNTNNEYHALTDAGSTLRPTRVLGGSLVAVKTAPDGKAAMEVFFGKGSYAFASGIAGGISFYAYGPSDLSSGNEFTLGYSIFFESGFDFVHGGKLPGLYGGTSNDEAASCSGGRHAATCFSTRFMWRDQGAAELYVYLPSDPANEFLCNGARIPGRNICGSDYGMSLGRGSFYFQAGQWNYVAQRIKLNTPGKADGQLQASTDTSPDHKFLLAFDFEFISYTRLGLHVIQARYYVLWKASSCLVCTLCGTTARAYGRSETSSFEEQEWTPVVCEALWSKVSLADMTPPGQVERTSDCGLQTLASRNSVDGISIANL